MLDGVTFACPGFQVWVIVCAVAPGTVIGAAAVTASVAPTATLDAGALRLLSTVTVGPTGGVATDGEAAAITPPNPTATTVATAPRRRTDRAKRWPVVGRNDEPAGMGGSWLGAPTWHEH